MKNKNPGSLYFIFAVILILMTVMIRVKAISMPVNGYRAPAHQDGYYDYEGVIHWHTEYSHDSFGTYKDLADLGNRYHLNFLISTEHNTLMALYDHQEGWHGQMLILTGLESSRQEGYLLGINFMKYTTRDLPTDQFISEVDSQGGFTIIAHPTNPRWHWRGKIDDRMVGQEIVDLTDQFATASPMDVLSGFLYYPFNKPAAFMQIYHRPADDLEMWDKITTQRDFVGIYAPDVHQSIRLWGRHVLQFPKADDTLPIAHDHVILNTPFSGQLAPDKAMLLDAIKKGRIYVSADILQDATGFFFWARQGDRSAWMGDDLRAGTHTDFRVRLPQPLFLKNTVIDVFHNGERIAQSKDANFSFQSSQAGSYRIEVEADIPTIGGWNKKEIWIFSNPIYLR